MGHGTDGGMKRGIPSITVAGGGPAGAVTACLLAREGLSVTLCESAVREQEKVGETLPPSATGLLKRLGLFSGSFAENHAPAYGIRCSWGSDIPEERDFVWERAGLGWHLNRKRFEQDLAEFAKRSGVEWRPATTVRQPCRCAEGWQFTLHSGGKDQLCRADFLVDATGRQRGIASVISPRIKCHDRLIGISCVLDLSAGETEERITLIEAVPNGWWYSAPMPHRRITVVFFTDRDLWRPRVQLSGGLGELLSLTRLTQRRICGRYGMATRFRLLAADSSELARCAGRRWLAVGDAANAFDPLADHGLVAAVGSAFYAARAIIDAINGRPDGPSRYAELMRETFRAYRRSLRTCYLHEQRWPNEPFWNRRHASIYEDGWRI